MTEFWSSVVTIFLAVAGIATLAVLVSKQANTPAVLQAAGSAGSSLLAAAVSPVTGGGSSALTLPTFGSGAGFLQ